jgi:hypothetical protein
MTTHGGGPRQQRHWMDRLAAIIDNPWVFLVFALTLATIAHFAWKGVQALT